MEILNNNEHFKSNEIGSINLDAVSFEFCEDKFIYDFYDKKSEELRNKEIWFEKNKDRFETEKEMIEKAARDGMIENSDPETIRNFLIQKVDLGKEKIIEIKKLLESSVKELLIDTAKKLSKYLPDWSAGKLKISLTINEDADFCIDGDEITVDLGRLMFEDNPIEEVKMGIAHELFHAWMAEGRKKRKDGLGAQSTQEVKEDIIYGIADEGIAVLISGQSLRKHHEEKGRDYDEYIKESFETFRKFENEDDQGALEKMKNQGFKDMGHFYVIGYEVVKKLLDHYGIGEFRALVVNIRENPSLLLEEYEK